MKASLLRSWTVARRHSRLSAFTIAHAHNVILKRKPSSLRKVPIVTPYHFRRDLEQKQIQVVVFDKPRDWCSHPFEVSLWLREDWGRSRPPVRLVNSFIPGRDATRPSHTDFIKSKKDVLFPVDRATSPILGPRVTWWKSRLLIGPFGSREHKWWRFNANETRDLKEQ